MKDYYLLPIQIVTINLDDSMRKPSLNVNLFHTLFLAILTEKLDL